MYVVGITITLYFYIHVFRCILGCTGSKPVKTKGVFIIAFSFILASGIKLFKYELKIISVFYRIVVKRHSSSLIPDSYSFVFMPYYQYFFSKSFSGLIN